MGQLIDTFVLVVSAMKGKLITLHKKSKKGTYDYICHWQGRSECDDSFHRHNRFPASSKRNEDGWFAAEPA